MRRRGCVGCREATPVLLEGLRMRGVPGRRCGGGAVRETVRIWVSANSRGRVQTLIEYLACSTM